MASVWGGEPPGPNSAPGDVDLLVKVDVPILLNNLRLKARSYRDNHERPLTATFMEQSVTTIEQLCERLSEAESRAAAAEEHVYSLHEHCEVLESIIASLRVGEAVPGEFIDRLLGGGKEGANDV